MTIEDCIRQGGEVWANTWKIGHVADPEIASIRAAIEEEYAIVDKDRWERWCIFFEEFHRGIYEGKATLEDIKELGAELLTADDAEYLFGDSGTRIAWEFVVADGDRVQARSQTR